MANYYDTATINAVKSFIVQPSGQNNDRDFTFCEKNLRRKHKTTTQWH
jgi:hypothetical protein